MLEIKNIHKQFDGEEVLKGINFKMEKGEVVAVLGPSGSGKTTLLRCINFLEHAEVGNITLGEISVSCEKAAKKDILNLRRKTGFVFQNYNLIHHKTALQNVMEPLTVVWRIPKDEAKEIAMRALDKVGLSQRYNFLPAQLSGGQQQRVGIARAIAVNPELILFDEPTSALDPELVGEVLDVIKKIACEGTSMLIVTHELEFARQVANKVIFMDGGVIIEENTAKKFFDNPKEERTRTFLQRFSQDYTYCI